MRKANELGGHVRKSEGSTIVVFWKVDKRRCEAQDESDVESNEQCRRRFVLRYFASGCDVKSLERLFDERRYTKKRTRCSITGSLPAHAALATARCEAAGTMYPRPWRRSEGRETGTRTPSIDGVRGLGCAAWSTKCEPLQPSLGRTSQRC